MFIFFHFFALLLNYIFYIHNVMNSKTSKTHITSNNKRKLFLTITLFFSHPWTSYLSHSFFHLFILFKLMHDPQN
jgi:hypothetical protein